MYTFAYARQVHIVYYLHDLAYTRWLKAENFISKLKDNNVTNTIGSHVDHFKVFRFS